MSEHDSRLTWEVVRRLEREAREQGAKAERERIKASFDSMLERGAFRRPLKEGTYSNSERPERSGRYWPDLIDALLADPEPTPEPEPGEGGR